MKRSLILLAYAATLGCTRHPNVVMQPEHLRVCGTLRGEDGKPINEAFVELHRRAKDTAEDIKANSFETALTDEQGTFHLGSAIADHQYWISVAGVNSCKSLGVEEQESRRVPVTFQGTPPAGECQATISLVLNNCTPKLQ
ncbi:MAG TPA: hypothetical protein VJO35_17345 [Terriglobales bacterium]|nr:hypothetical protein [Terriglobales bacterium]